MSNRTKYSKIITVSGGTYRWMRCKVRLPLVDGNQLVLATSSIKGESSCQCCFLAKKGSRYWIPLTFLGEVYTPAMRLAAMEKDIKERSSMLKGLKLKYESTTHPLKARKEVIRILEEALS